METHKWRFLFTQNVQNFCLSLCPQISECSSQQIQGLSSLRSSLATLSIHHSTETMMVQFKIHAPLQHTCSCMSCVSWTNFAWRVLATFSRSWSRRRASSHSGRLKGRRLAALSQLSFLCGETWPRWTWATTASAPSTDLWWDALAKTRCEPRSVTCTSSYMLTLSISLL